MKDANFYIKLGSAIRKQRIKKKITLKEISKKVNISIQQFQKYETGANRIPIDKLEKVSKILGESSDTLIKNANEHIIYS